MVACSACPEKPSSMHGREQYAPILADAAQGRMPPTPVRIDGRPISPVVVASPAVERGGHRSHSSTAVLLDLRAPLDLTHFGIVSRRLSHRAINSGLVALLGFLPHPSPQRQYIAHLCDNRSSAFAGLRCG